MKTDIVATIGPACDSEETLEAMVEAGMTIARVNFSHAKPEGYKAIKEKLERIGKKTGKHVKMLADLQGPRMRVGILPEEGVRLFGDHEVVFTTDEDQKEYKDAKEGNGAIFIDNPVLHEEIKAGEPLYLLNGDIECVVSRVEGHIIYANIIHGGILFSRKGVNTPLTKLSIAGLTVKDMDDARAVLENGVDYFAVSFVQRASDLAPLRELAGSRAKIISKVESAFALDYIDEIIRESDAIMIARGDLGIEVPREKVPYIQRHLIRHSTWHKTPSITATQMLMSMVNHPTPTRAEVTDIANALREGTDAVMLSDETAGGKYPVEAVRVMARIVQEEEKRMFEREFSL